MQPTVELDKDPPPLTKGVQPLKAIQLRYVYRALKTLGFNRTSTARALEISVRTLRIYVGQLRAEGFQLDAAESAHVALVRPPKPRVTTPCNWCRAAVNRAPAPTALQVFCNRACYMSARAQAKSVRLAKKESRRQTYRTWGARR